MGSFVEALEERALFTGTSVGIYAEKLNASENHPTSSGKGVFLVKRPTGSVADMLTLKYYVSGSLNNGTNTGPDPNDSITQSDRTTTAIDQTRNTDIGSGNGQEWLYFRDSSVGSAGRYFFASHDGAPDNLVDSYFKMA